MGSVGFLVVLPVQMAQNKKITLAQSAKGGSVPGECAVLHAGRAGQSQRAGVAGRRCCQV